jgi:hypothetical protein
MKMYGGSGFIDSHFLDLGTRWKRVVSFMPRPLYPPGKAPVYIGGWVDPRAGVNDIEKLKFFAPQSSNIHCHLNTEVVQLHTEMQEQLKNCIYIKT